MHGEDVEYQRRHEVVERKHLVERGQRRVSCWMELQGKACLEGIREGKG